MKEYLKYAWDSEYKYSVKSAENATPHTISAALNSAMQKDKAVYGEASPYTGCAWAGFPSGQTEMGVGGLGRQIWKGAFSDFCPPCFN